MRESPVKPGGSWTQQTSCALPRLLTGSSRRESAPVQTGAAFSPACRSGTPLAAAFEATGIEPGTLYEYRRHTFGSLAELGGISTWRLKEIMGHADISTTERYVSLAGQALTGQELAALGG